MQGAGRVPDSAGEVLQWTEISNDVAGTRESPSTGLEIATYYSLSQLQMGHLSVSGRIPC